MALLLFQGSLICHCVFLVARDGASQPGTESSRGDRGQMVEKSSFGEGHIQSQLWQQEMVDTVGAHT